MAGTYKVNNDKLTGITVYSTLPIGTVIATVSTSEVGFLAFDGNEYNGADYPELYEKVKNLTAFQSETEGYFKLPNLAGRTIQQAENELGVLVEAGLPNIKGDFTSSTYSNSEQTKDEMFSGAFFRKLASDKEENKYGFDILGDSTHYSDRAVKGFDASRSSSIYKDDCDTVQPPAITLNFLIKAVDYVSLPQNAIDDTVTTTGNAWSADKIAEYVQNYNKLSDYEEVQASEFGNSEATAYEAEYDGFFIVECLDGSGGKYAYMQIKTVEGTTRRFDVLATSGGKQTSSIPVQKGDKLWYTERSSAIAYSFRYYKNR